MKVLTLLLLGIFCLQATVQAQFNFGLNSSLGGGSQVDYSNPAEYTIEAIDVTGVEFLDKNSLISISGLRVGQKIRVPGDDISDAIKNLWKQGLLGNIEITATKMANGKISLLFILSERPRLARYEYKGVGKNQQETLNDKVSLIRGRIVTDVMVKNAQTIIYNHYAEKGFLNCKVNITKQKDDLLANSVKLIIDIQKGSKVKVAQISIEGNKEIPSSKIQKKLKNTKQKQFGRFWKPSKYTKKDFDEDKITLIDFYNEQGYRNARIIGDSIYNVNEEEVGIVVKIEEGNKFYYRNIEWTGNYLYTDEALAQVLGIQKGDVYNPNELSERLNYNPQGTDVTSLYMDDGYLFFSIKPVEVMVDEDSIDVEMRISEGEQAHISKIIVNGNTKTNDHVVFREIRTYPGQKFSRSQLIRTQRELSQLGYFNPESMGLNPIPNLADGTVDIEYSLEEKPNDQIELSGGWGGYFGFVGTVGLVFNNFSAKNIFNFKSYKPLPTGDGQRLSLRIQANGTQFQTYSVSFTEPWLGGRQPNSLTISANHSTQRAFAGSSQTGSLSVTGLTGMFGKRLKIPDDYFTLSSSLSLLQYDLNNWYANGFGNYRNGQSYNISLTTTLSRNSIDNPMYPRSGSQVSFSAILTPPYSIMSGNTFGDGTNDSDRYRWVEYHKYMIDNSWFMQIVGNLVLNTRIHFGFINSYNSSKGVGPFDRFILGGSGLSQNSFLLGTDIVGLRGYTDNSLTPPDTNGEGGVAYAKYVMELRYPISLNPAATIYLTTFMEGGNNWSAVNEFDPFNVKRTVGIGARIFMPAFGLLGVDYAYGFDYVEGSGTVIRSGTQFHFTIGQQIR